MSAPLVAVVDSEAQRWQAWHARGAEHERRRASTMRWVLAVIVLMLGGLFFGRLL